MEAWTTVCETVESLSSKEDLSSEERAFLLLYSSLGLQLLSPGEREGTAHSILVLCATIFLESESKIFME